MPCFVALLAFFSPRLALIAMWLFSDVLSRSLDGWLLPFIGFFVLPWTTLVWAAMWSYGTNEVAGFEWFIVGLAFLADLGAFGAGQRARSSRSSSAAY